MLTHRTEQNEQNMWYDTVAKANSTTAGQPEPKRWTGNWTQWAQWQTRTKTIGITVASTKSENRDSDKHKWLKARA